MNRRNTSVLIASVLAATTIGAISLAAQPERGPGFQQIGQALVEGLSNTPGCLGVETANTTSGKNVIFAWFKDKQAAMEWYNSPMHQRLSQRLLPERPEGYTPMRYIADDSGPILVIASLMPAERPLPGMRMPISQIAIEMYSPLPGGLRLNGGFTPEAVPVRGRIDRTIAPEPAAEPGQDR